MIKIVHCADMHFDTLFAELPPHLAEIRRGELLSTFERIIDRTLEFGADVLLIAGDVFENEYVSYQTVEFIKRCFAKIPNIPVFIAPGNHDAIGGNEIYEKINLGDNVTVFGQGLKDFVFADKGFRVYGHGFTEKYEKATYWDDLVCPDDGLVNIFVGHCSLPPYTEERFAPLSSEQIENSGIHYLAAGHIHNHEGIKRAGDTVYAYCGIPEGRKFDEDGEKGIIMGEVSCDKIDVSFVPICSRKFITLKVDINECLTYDDILTKVNINENDIYRIILIGERKESIIFDTNALEKLLLEKTFYAKVIDKSLELLPTEPGLMEKSFLDKLASNPSNEETVKLAKEFGVAALRGKKVGYR